MLVLLGSDRGAAAIKRPFPALLDLDLRSNEWSLPLPDSFLGGSAPRLRSIRLYSVVPFPGIQKLLSSTSELIHLDLWNVPESGHISPELMVTSLPSLAQLKTLRLGFRSRSGPESRHPSPQTHVVLPNLTQFWFQGVSEYLEGLVAHIDAPLLHSVRITSFNQLPFDISGLPQFKSSRRSTPLGRICAFSRTPSNLSSPRKQKQRQLTASCLH